MRKFVLVALIISLSVGLFSCNEFPEKHWSQAIPQKTPAVIVPSSGLSPTQLLEQEYIPFLDDITSSAIQLVSAIDSYPTIDLRLHALALYPGIEDRLQPMWLVEAPSGFVKTLHQSFFEEFTQNQYSFSGQLIYKLNVQDRTIFASQLHGLLLLSESSQAIEDAIRTYVGYQPAVAIESGQIQSDSVILNTPSLDRWIDQLVQVLHRPSIRGAFSGTGPAVVQIDKLTEGESSNELRFTGTIPLINSNRSELVNALSSENAPVTLDQYIPSSAASFAIFRLPPRLAPPSTVPDTTRLDSVFLANSTYYRNLARSLDPEFSQVAFSESGAQSTGEYLFIRKLSDQEQFVNQLEELADEGVLRPSDDTYIAEGSILSSLIGSELCNFSNYYLNVVDNAVVITKRKGRAENMESDRNRRQVIYYDQDYMEIRRNLPEEMSGFVFANSEIYDFVQSYLVSETYANVIASQFSQLTMSFQLNDSGEQLAFEMRTYRQEESNIPYEEQWFFSTGGAELSGEPVLSNIRGSAREEIIFATTTGSLYALATDGTTVMQTNTGSDQPIGSPVVYDWYGTNQQIILLAAGNKIYGWNDTGSALPQFPFTLNETITTPLVVADIDQNGLPEAIVATADRQLHVLNGRGNNLNGWPVTTNAVINQQPVVGSFQGSNSVVAFSENAVHAWNSDASPKQNFPTFINASLNGSPRIYNDKILGAAADGYLYAVGPSTLFPDSVNIYSTRSEPDGTEAVYVSNSGLTGTPSVHSLTVQTEEQTYRENMILTMSTNGSLFLINEQGQLRLTRSMGQPAAQNFSPFVTDINSDGITDITGLASFGRFYAWQVLDGERIQQLPTNGMQYPIVVDWDGDGNKELIAQTSEGVRSWTIYQRTSRSSEDSTAQE